MNLVSHYIFILGVSWNLVQSNKFWLCSWWANGVTVLHSKIALTVVNALGYFAGKILAGIPEWSPCCCMASLVYVRRVIKMSKSDSGRQQWLQTQVTLNMSVTSWESLMLQSWVNIGLSKIMTLKAPCLYMGTAVLLHAIRCRIEAWLSGRGEG